MSGWRSQSLAQQLRRFVEDDASRIEGRGRLRRGGLSAAEVRSGSVLASIGQNALASDEIENKDELQAAKVLASIPQGRQLRDDAEALDWRPNTSFKGKLIMASGKAKPVTLDGGLKVTVVGPLQPELQALQEAHDKWLRDQKKKKKIPGIRPRRLLRRIRAQSVQPRRAGGSGGQALAADR